jgi:UDP-2-acetamido-2-deoxy-ribo-hexuluronate aminotransferase
MNGNHLKSDSTLRLNIVLNSDIVLNLLSLTPNDIQHSFARLQKMPTRFWIPGCLLAVLTQQITPQHRSLNQLLEQTQLLSSLAAHWEKIPAAHPNKIQALISLDAAILPGHTIIWTHDEEFFPAPEGVEAGDHEFVYAMLAEYESESLPFVDLVTPQLDLRAQIENALLIVLKHGEYVLGPEVETLERELANLVGSKHCICVSNHADALLIALSAVGVEAGDEVVLSAFTSVANAEMVMLLGAIPVFVDIDPETYNLDPNLLAKRLNPKTKAVIVTNTYGQCADFDTIVQIAGRSCVSVIEDASHSFGAQYKNRCSGSLATVSYTSFAPYRTLSTCGKAGACFTNSSPMADIIRQLRQHGQMEKHNHRLLGLSSRLNTLQASVLLAKLPYFPPERERRLQVSRSYYELLAKFQDALKLPIILAENESIYAEFTIEVDERDKVQAHLGKRGITTHIYYPVPVHLQPAFCGLGYQVGDFPIAERAAQRVLSLPMHAYLTTDLQNKIIKGLNEVLL